MDVGLFVDGATGPVHGMHSSIYRWTHTCHNQIFGVIFRLSRLYCMASILKVVLLLDQLAWHLVESTDSDWVFSIDLKRGYLTAHFSARLLIDVVGVIAALVLHFKHWWTLCDFSQRVGSSSVRCRGRYGVNAIAFAGWRHFDLLLTGRFIIRFDKFRTELRDYSVIRRLLFLL